MNNTTYIRLTPPMFDVVRMAKQLRPPNLPGYSGKDVMGFAGRMKDLGQHVVRFTVIVEAVKTASHETLPEKLRELTEHRLRLRGHSKGDPTPPAPQAPPQP